MRDTLCLEDQPVARYLPLQNTYNHKYWSPEEGIRPWKDSARWPKTKVSVLDKQAKIPMAVKRFQRRTPCPSAVIHVSGLHLGGQWDYCQSLVAERNTFLFYSARTPWSHNRIGYFPNHGSLSRVVAILSYMTRHSGLYSIRICYCRRSSLIWLETERNTCRRAK
jgi:hypothetical protein